MNRAFDSKTQGLIFACLIAHMIGFMQLVQLPISIISQARLLQILAHV